MRTYLAVTVSFLAGASQLQAARQSPCERAPVAGRAQIHGIVQDSATLLPLQALGVVVSWYGDDVRRADARTDHTGAFTFCDLPANTELRVETQSPRRAVRVVEVASGDAQRLTIVVDGVHASVTGRVIDNRGGRGIAQADVRIRNTDVRAVTDDDGGFELPDIPAGVYWLEVTHLAYADRGDSVRVAPGVRSLLTIRLAESVIELAPIRVQVRSAGLERAGFYERQDRGFGSFLTRSDWLGRAPNRPTDVLRALAGVRIVPRRDGAGSMPLDRGSCAFRYVVDGVRIGYTFQVDDMPVETIDAIEVYRGASTIPPQFAFPTTQPRANCGVIVIWTRRPGG
jgi:hypothetical protein